MKRNSNLQVLDMIIGMKGEFCVGSALLVEECAIHMAFFKNSKTDKIGNISSYRDRMRNKI